MHGTVHRFENLKETRSRPLEGQAGGLAAERLGVGESEPRGLAGRVSGGEAALRSSCPAEGSSHLTGNPRRTISSVTGLLIRVLTTSTFLRSVSRDQLQSKL